KGGSSYNRGRPIFGSKLCGTNYPLSICFIVVNEFCERFSYYGMKAVLTLYFLSYLKWDKDLSTAVYHAFSGLCYFTPILGALIADSWLGKFKTIIYLSIVYVIGHVIKSVGAIPTVGNKDVHIALSMLGLILIAFGTGGIKPCVAAFGGDQFDEDSMKERQKFFSIFYMSINAGSLLSTVITPVLRGEHSPYCYALAFGVPAALMMVALAVFIFGSSLYKKNPPQGNILLQVCNCIGFAIKNRWNSSKSAPKRTHWLDWAEDKYSKRLIEEIRMVLRVLVLYIPLPMFWALFDQQVQEDSAQICTSCFYELQFKYQKQFSGNLLSYILWISESGPAGLWSLLHVHPPPGQQALFRYITELISHTRRTCSVSRQESGTIVAKRMEDVEANNVHIAWQIPQYVLLTAGEVMFSITGLEFSYSQAPTNMKSVLQAGWLLTVAFGNVIVLIVAEGAGLEQWKEFLLFAGLLLGVCVIFSIMAYFYTNNDPEQLDKIFLEDSRWDEDEDDNMKKKNEEIQLNKAGKSTRL
uniref:Solute carrier family 15 member 2 n=1 Tax=Nothobranchius furzeri TaxID=105023 RepID=A0A8C6LJ12_NOTFU